MSGAPGVYALFVADEEGGAWKGALSAARTVMQARNAEMFARAESLAEADRFIDERIDEMRGCLEDLESGLVVALNAVNYTLLSFMPTYFATQLGLTTDESLIVPIVGMLFMMLFLPFVGYLSDRIGRKPLWWLSLGGIFILAIPLYHLMAAGFKEAMFGFALLGLLYVPQLATISATFPAMFPTQVRFAGFAIAYNVSTSLFGGTAPAVND